MTRDDGSLRGIWPVMMIIGANIAINISFLISMAITESSKFMFGKINGQTKLEIFIASMIICVTMIVLSVFNVRELQHVRAFVMRDFDNVEN